MMSVSTFSLVPSLAPTLLVAAGGAVGAAARFQMSRAVLALTGGPGVFPWGTLAVNCIGSLAMGLLVGWLARTGGAGVASGAGTGAGTGAGMGTGAEHLRLLLGVGVLGGFTTFSAFSLELLLLIERGSAGLALVYAGLSLTAGLAALYIGLVAMRGAA